MTDGVTQAMYGMDRPSYLALASYRAHQVGSSPHYSSFGPAGRLSYDEITRMPALFSAKDSTMPGTVLPGRGYDPVAIDPAMYLKKPASAGVETLLQ